MRECPLLPVGPRQRHENGRFYVLPLGNSDEFVPSNEYAFDTAVILTHFKYVENYTQLGLLVKEVFFVLSFSLNLFFPTELYFS